MVETEASAKPILTAFILALGLALAAAIFGVFFYQARIQNRSIAVVGAATQRFDSDIVKWRINFGRMTDLSDVKNGYSTMQKDLQLITEQLKVNNVKDEDITIQPLTTQPSYNQYGTITGYNLNQGIFVISDEISTIEKLALNPSALFSQGVIFQGSYLEYSHLLISSFGCWPLYSFPRSGRCRLLPTHHSWLPYLSNEAFS